MKLIVDSIRHRITWDGHNITDLTRLEFQILYLLCEDPGRVFTRKQIFSKIWDSSSQTNERTVDVHIVQLRKKISKELIKSIKGVGYKLTLDPQQVDLVK